MGRIRTIKPEFFTNEGLSGLSAETHLFAAGLLCYADDEGYFNANPALIKGSIFPLREPSVSIHGMLTELSVNGYLLLGSTRDGRTWGRIVAFSTHQRVNRPSPSKIKALPVEWDPSLNTHGGLTEGSLNTHGGLTEPSLNTHGGLTEGSVQERKGKERKGKDGVLDADDLEPSMVTTAVMDDLHLSGMKLRIVLDEVCSREMGLGMGADDLRAALVAAWQEYEASKPRLSYTCGAEKFFGELWRNKAGWPWKDGQAPAAPKAPVADPEPRQLNVHQLERIRLGLDPNKNALDDIRERMRRELGMPLVN